MKILFTAILLCLSVPHTFASEWPGTTESYSTVNYISSILIDDSTLWALSSGGLVRWDLSDDSYHIYEPYVDMPAGVPIQILAQAPDGSIWLRINDLGIVSFDGETMQQLDENTTFKGYIVRDLSFDSDGTPWVIGGGQIMKYIDGKWTQVNLGKVGSALDIAPDGNLWVSHLASSIDGPLGGYGVSQYKGGIWIPHNETNGLSDDRVKDIAFGPSGEVWIVSEAGVSMYDGENWTQYGATNGLPTNGLERIHCTLDGTVWVVTLNGIFELDNNTWTFFSYVDMQLPGGILSIINSSDGAVWLSSYTEITRYKDGVWTQLITEKEIGSRSYRTLIEGPEGSIWTGSTYGLISYRNEVWSAHYVVAPVSTEINASAKDLDGDIWLSTRYGVARYGASGWTNYTMEDGLPYNRISDVGVDSDGNIWVGSDGGVSVFDGNSWKTYTTDDGLKHNWVQEVGVISPSDVWIAYEANGIGHFDGTSWTNIEPSESLPLNYVMKITVDDDGDVWFAANISVCLYRDGEWTVFRENSDLPGNWSRYVAGDSKGNAWCSLGTLENQLCYYDGSGWAYYKTPGNSFITGVIGIMVDSSDTVWISTGDGRIHSIDGEKYETLSVEEITGRPNLVARYINPEEKILIASNNSQLIVHKGMETFVEKSNAVPSEIFLLQNTPNPFNLSTTIEYSISQNVKVNLSVYNISGQRVTVLKDDYQQAGNYTVNWDATGFPSGQYYCILEANGFTQTRKMVLVK
ncbi:two-component regulator propeller domain-containing protein [Candidatus Latescibacterota bacterium]